MHYKDHVTSVELNISKLLIWMENDRADKRVCDISTPYHDVTTATILLLC